MESAMPQEPELNKLFRTVKMVGASALNLTVGQPPMARLRGDIRRMACAVLTDDDMLHLLHSVMGEQERQELEEKGSVDFTHVVGNGECRFRCRVSTQHARLSLYARLLQQKAAQSSHVSPDNE